MKTLIFLMLCILQNALISWISINGGVFYPVIPTSGFWFGALLFIFIIYDLDSLDNLKRNR